MQTTMAQRIHISDYSLLFVQVVRILFIFFFALNFVNKK